MCTFNDWVPYNLDFSPLSPTPPNVIFPSYENFENATDTQQKYNHFIRVYTYVHLFTRIIIHMDMG